MLFPHFVSLDPTSERFFTQKDRYLISLSVLLSKSIHVEANRMISFVNMYSSLSSHLFLGCIQFLAFVTSAAMNIGVQMSSLNRDFGPWG